MTARRKHPLFLWILFALILFGGAMILLDLLIHHPPFQQYLIQKIAATARYDIQTGKIRIGFRGGLGIHATDLTARSRSSALEIAARQIDIAFKYRALLKGHLIPERAFIKDARILATPSPARQGANTRAPDPARIIGALFVGFKQVTIENASLTLSGRADHITHLNAAIRATDADPGSRDIRLDGLFKSGDTRSPFQLAGTVSRVPGKDLLFSTQSTLTVSDFPLARIPWPRHVPFAAGRASGQITISGVIGANMAMTGQFAASDLRFAVVKHERTKAYHLSHADIDFTGRVGPENIHLDKLTCQLPETSVSLTMQLEWEKRTSPKLDLDIHSPFMPLAVFKRIFPTPLVAEWIESRLFPLFSRGSARLDRFRLNGTIDRITALNQPANADALELRLTLDKVTALTAGPGLPVTGVSGKVAIAGGQLKIADVAGHFGQSDIRGASAVWPDLYGKSGAFHLGLRGDFQMADLKAQSRQPVLPGVIRRAIDHFSDARGPLSADIDLFFPTSRHSPVVTGTLTTAQSRISHTALPLPLSLTAARIVFNGNKPMHLDGRGQWGRSDFSLTGTHAYPWPAKKSPHPAMNLDIVADTDLTDLLILRDWPALPATFRSICSGIRTISGRVSANANIRRTAAQAAPVEISGKFTTSRLALEHLKLRQPLDIQKGELVITAPGQGQFTAGGKWGHTAFNAGGHLFFDGTVAEISIDTRADVNEIISVFRADAPLPVTLSAPLSGHLDIKKTDDHWAIAGEADLDETIIRLPGLSLAPPGENNRLDFSLAYAPDGGVTLNHCQFHKNDSRLEVQGAWTGRPDDDLSFSLAADTLRLSTLGITINGTPPVPVLGRLSGRLTGRLPGQSHAAPLLIGDLAASNLTFSASADAPRYSADLRFSGQAVDIITLSFPLATGRATLKGHLDAGDHWQGQLYLTADTLDLPRLIRRVRDARSPDTGRNTNKSLVDRLSASDLTLTATVEKTMWEGIDLGTLKTSIRYRNQLLTIPKAVLTAPDSLIKLSGTLAGRTHPGISLLTYIKLNNKPIHALLAGLDIHTRRIQGTASLEGGLFFGGKSKDEIIRNLEGQVNINLTEGQIDKPSIILKILDFLSIQNIFQRRPPSIIREHFYFKNIRGHIKVHKGILTADRLFMKSPVFNAAAKGSLDLPNNHLRVAIGVQPLNTIDFLVSKIPIVGHILTGKEKTILVYYFKVRGPLENPTVKQVPFNNLGKALGGYFKRLFLTPVRIWSKISATLSDIEKGIEAGTNIPVLTDER